VTATVALAFVFAGSQFLAFDAQRVAFIVLNRSDRTFSIAYVEDGKDRIVVHGLGPGNTADINGLPMSSTACAPGDLVARDLPRGIEVARRTGPLCNSARWEISLASPSPS
jgi:hypothetical protein